VNELEISYEIAYRRDRMLHSGRGTWVSVSAFNRWFRRLRGYHAVVDDHVSPGERRSAIGSGISWVHRTARIRPTVYLAPGCLLGPHVVVQDYAVVGRDVRVGRGAVVGSGAILERCARVGRGARVAAGSIVAEGTRVPSHTHHQGRT